MTSLNIGNPTPDRRPNASTKGGGKCPGCGAGPEKRIAGGGFGPVKVTLCGECGFEFQE